jgi:hypothetical protein
MPEKNVFPLTVRLTGWRLRSSRFTVAVSAALPAFLVFLGVRDSPGTAMKFFLFFFPYVFLLSAQDMVATERSGGGLQNVIFLRGKFKTYLWQKNLALAAAAGIYAACLFVLLWFWGIARGGLDPFPVVPFGMGLLAGLYYVGLAGALSWLLKSGSNVVVILLAQAAWLIGLLFSATSQSGFIDYLGTGRFPGLESRLLFLGLTSVFPNLIVSRRLFMGAPVVVAGLALALIFQRVRVRRLELRAQGE